MDLLSRVWGRSRSDLPAIPSGDRLAVIEDVDRSDLLVPGVNTNITTLMPSILLNLRVFEAILIGVELKFILCLLVGPLP